MHENKERKLKDTRQMLYKLKEGSVPGRHSLPGLHRYQRNPQLPCCQSLQLGNRPFSGSKGSP
jgi:hypothetical protein